MSADGFINGRFLLHDNKCGTFSFILKKECNFKILLFFRFSVQLGFDSSLTSLKALMIAMLQTVKIACNSRAAQVTELISTRLTVCAAMS